MPAPVVDSIELISGAAVALTTDPSSPAYNEFYLSGSNLGDTKTVALDSGSDYSWVVGSVSASANSVTISAYAFGSANGTGSVVANVSTPSATVASPALEVDFVALTLLD